MTSSDARSRIVATVLAALAGYVDAIGFSASGGFFLSFMSGNSTRLAVGLADRPGFALTAAGLIAAFVTGVVIAALIVRRRGSRARAVLVTVSVTLGVAAAAAEFALPLAALALAAAAMGAVNLVFEEAGEVRIGLTYMTGTLVRIGQRIAVALAGGKRWGWLPHLLLWSGLVLGAVAGALTFNAIGLRGLWIAAAASLAVALLIRPTAE